MLMKLRMINASALFIQNFHQPKSAVLALESVLTNTHRLITLARLIQLIRH